MNSVGIVCGYDLHTPLSDYMSRIAPFLEREPVDCLILSGGRTSRRRAESEAAVMANALAEILPAQCVVLEEQAMTTLDNLVFARAIVGDRVERVVVFCGTTHQRKVRVLTRLVFGAQAVVHAVPRSAPLLIRLLEPVSLVIEAGGAMIPRLRHPIRRAAMWWKGVKPGYGALRTSVTQ